MTKRAVSRNGAILRSVGGFQPGFHATRQMQCERRRSVFGILFLFIALS
jgi:hypothetical protein